jgi:hypothetical protein
LKVCRFRDRETVLGKKEKNETKSKHGELAWKPKTQKEFDALWETVFEWDDMRIKEICQRV